MGREGARAIRPDDDEVTCVPRPFPWPLPPKTRADARRHKKKVATGVSEGFSP